MSKARKGSFWLMVAGLSAVVALASPEATAGERLVAWIDEPFEVNGEIYAAGELSLKPISVLSPGARLHEFRVSGATRGLLLVRDSEGGSVASRRELTFLRATDGHLVLESIGVAGAPVGMVFTYSSAAGQWSANVSVPQPI